MPPLNADEHPGIIPAVDRLRELLAADDRPEVAQLLDHIEDVTRDRVKARHAPPPGDPDAVFGEAMAGVNYDRM